MEAGNQSMCRELLSSQTSEQLKASAVNGDTALHLAVRRKDIDMVTNQNFHYFKTKNNMNTLHDLG